MPRSKNLMSVALAVATMAAWIAPTAGEEMSVDAAWKTLPGYEYGQDMAPLLAIDRGVIEAMNSAEARSACAAHLASLLAADETTPAARQYLCLQLRQVGTPAEVPLLAELLGKPATAEMARYALEKIPGKEASSALRTALDSQKGMLLVGVIHSIAAREDAFAVDKLIALADSADTQVASAALSALGDLGTPRCAEFLLERAERTGTPTPQSLAVPLLRCAEAALASGRTGHAKKIFLEMGQPSQQAGVHRAGLEGLLRLDGDRMPETILAWFLGEDAVRRRIAAGHLRQLSDEQLGTLLADLAELPADAKLTVIELNAARRGKAVLPMLRSLLESDDPAAQRAGIQCLGMVGDASVIPDLIEVLGSDDAFAASARKALMNLPRKPVTAALLDALRDRPKALRPVVDCLVELKCYDAIDPLIEIALEDHPIEYGPALDGLRGIADPDKTDIPRLVKLLLRTEPGKHRDEVEKTILIVCDKLPADADRSALVRAALAKEDAAELPTYLPLLGRLGGPESLKLIEKHLDSDDPAIREAAVRALCNWPNADVADRLIELASKSGNRFSRIAALRAYIRVVSLKSDRPAAETLAMLQKAFELAERPDEKRLAIERAATVRTMDTVSWLASLLDDPELNQAACKSLVELAHHRFLRHPNMDRFRPILEKVEKTSKDPAIVERAKRYRLGL